MAMHLLLEKNAGKRFDLDLIGDRIKRPPARWKTDSHIMVWDMPQDWDTSKVMEEMTILGIGAAELGIDVWGAIGAHK